MKNTLIALASGLMLALTATVSQADVILQANDADPYFLGSVDPGGGSPTQEANDLNVLLSLSVNNTNTYTDVNGTFYNRSDNTCIGCPSATAVGAIGDETAPIQTTDINVTNWTYLKAKYGNTSVYWYVADINDEVTIPANFGPGGSGTGAGGGISHWLVFNPTPQQVPDGGTTLGLLGLGMLGLGYLRRRIQ